MKKMLLLGAVLMALSSVPANATLGNGCSNYGGGSWDGQISCSYTATGAGTFVAATPSEWEITTIRNNRFVVLASGGRFAPPSSGSFPSAAGEKIYVTMGPTICHFVFCFSIGSVTARETA